MHDTDIDHQATHLNSVLDRCLDSLCGWAHIQHNPALLLHLGHILSSDVLDPAIPDLALPTLLQLLLVGLDLDSHIALAARWGEV